MYSVDNLIPYVSEIASTCWTHHHSTFWDPLWGPPTSLSRPQANKTLSIKHAYWSTSGLIITSSRWESLGCFCSSLSCLGSAFVVYGSHQASIQQANTTHSQASRTVANTGSKLIMIHQPYLREVSPLTLSYAAASNILVHSPPPTSHSLHIHPTSSSLGNLLRSHFPPPLSVQTLTRKLRNTLRTMFVYLIPIVRSSGAHTYVSRKSKCGRLEWA